MSLPEEVKATPANAPMSAKERLAAKAKKAAPPGPKKKARGTIEVGDTDEEKVYAKAIDRLTAASHAQKAVEGHYKAAKAIVLPYIQKIVLRDWAEQGRKGENPRVQTSKGSSFILQCKNTLSGPRGFRVPKDDNGVPVSIEDHLTSSGIPQDLIALLMNEREFASETVLSVNMPKLEKEHSNLAARLMDLIDAAGNGGVTKADGTNISFSDAEMETILEVNNDVTVKEGFLERSIKHCLTAADNDIDLASELLFKVLSAVPPQWAVSGVNCINPDEEIVRLLHEEPAASSAPTKPPQVISSANNMYTIRIAGKVIEVVRNRDSKLVGTKNCRDDRHAANTIKQWQADQTKLDAFVAENA